MIDARATIHAGGTVDALALAHHGLAVSQYQYWETLYRAHPNHAPTLNARNAWRSTVRALEEFYGLPRTFETVAENRPRGGVRRKGDAA